MQSLIRGAIVVWFALAGSALAQDKLVLVELYTSQGCSSCPPADAILSKLAARDDVIALGLHVDYWDYIGWKDVFGSPSWSERQKAYARAQGHRSVYTPQLVVGGHDNVVGHDPMRLMELIAAHKRQPYPVALQVDTGAKGRVRVQAALRADGAPGKMELLLVRYIDRQDVAIKRGENAGRTIAYHNIVTSITRVGEWDGRRPLSVDLSLKGDAPAALVVQRDGMGPVVAAARLR